MEWNRENSKTLFKVVAFGVVLHWALQNLPLLRSGLGWLLGLIGPFLLGGCIAFILSVPLRPIEGFLFSGKRANSKLKRPLSLVVTLLLLVAFIVLLFGLVIPELGNSFLLLRDNMLRFWDRMETQHPAFLDQFIAYLPSTEELQKLDWQALAQKAWGILGSGASSLINSTVSVASRIMGSLVSLSLGFVFALYVLMDKEKLALQGRQALFAFLPHERAQRVLEILALCNKTFSSFLSGQCLEALILGILFFIAMTLLRFPYALMISSVIAVTALIPIFGAFIGCVIGAFMILMTGGFMQALWFVGLFLLIQQLEGNLIYPKVVGSSVGLPSIWVFAAVTIGGSAFGVVGMLVFIPLCSVLYSLWNQNVQRRLALQGPVAPIPGEKRPEKAPKPKKK